jgi:hypothetical protein
MTLLEAFGKWGTDVAAEIAAVTGICNLVLLLRGKRDCFIVRLGSASPNIDEEETMHVVSLSEHSVKLVDWGFIEADGTFRSVQMDWETGSLHNEEIRFDGSSNLAKRGDHFEIGYLRRDPPHGAFARSITQHRPRLYFSPLMPRYKRLRIRARLCFQPHYLAW